MNVLITSGGTREPIDGVRVIANQSTGATGAMLADAFARTGAAVTLLRAQASAAPADARVACERFNTVDDLDRLCAQVLSQQHIDVMIHAAAVSDFVVAAVVVNGVRQLAPVAQKLSSSATLTVELKPGKKILPQLKSYSQNALLKLIGFKLTDGASPAETRDAVEKLFLAGADAVIHNDLQTISTLRATLWRANGDTQRLPTAADLAAALIALAAS